MFSSNDGDAAIPSRRDGEAAPAGALLDEQARLLEGVARRWPLADCLRALTAAAARLAPGTRAAVLLADDAGRALADGCSADIPAGFVAALRGVAIHGGAGGSCSLALHRGEPVECVDTAVPGNWSERWRGLCAAHGIRACLSTPAIGRDGRGLASFFLAFDAPRRASDWERRVGAFGAHIAAIVIERDADDAAHAAALATLTASEERYRTLFESIEEGFCIVELLFDAAGRPVDYRFLQANPAFERMAGLQGAIGRTVRELVPDLEDFWFEVYGRVALTGQPAVFEHQAAPLGRWFDVRASRIGGPESRQVAIVFNNITARKAHEAALRDREERFRALADSAPAMLWVTGCDHRLDFISRGWFEHTGQSEVEAYADDGFGWMRAVHPEDRERAGAAFVAAAEVREGFLIEYRLRSARGGWRWALDMGRPRFGEAGEWLGYVGTVIDVHDRVEARAALERADRRKDEFLATLAHELRNPLAPIRNALHLLQHGGAAVPAERLHEMLDRQVSHMVRLVDDLLEVSRISRGAIELQRERLDLGAVLRAAVETSRPLLDGGRHALELQLPGEPLAVDGDPVRLAQVFANLLNNAAKYTDDGGRIELVAARDGADALVQVRDNGIGIAAAQLPHLFELFSQLGRDNSARSQGGLGIGLNLVQRLVGMHGGSVEAASAGAGRGSSFTVRLPLADAASAPPAAAPRTAAGAADGDGAMRRLQVMVVDDNRDAADSLAMLLGALGAEPRVVHDGPAALAALAGWTPHVVLLDIGMPGMDGCEVARRIRADRGLRALTLVALTGWGQDEDRRRTAEAGFDAHLVKPADPAVLQDLLGSVAAARSTASHAG